MKKITELSNEALHQQTIQAAGIEKKSTLSLLEFLSEVDRRRLYAARGFGSLWEYVHKALGYSEAQASERVSSMRLIQHVPEVANQLREGKLTLTTTAKLALFVRRENLAPDKTVFILEKIAGKSSREVERVLIDEQNAVIPARPDRIKAVSSKAMRLSFDADEEFLKLVEKIRQIKGNPALGLEELFKLAMTEFIEKRQPKTKSQKTDQTAPIPRAPEVRSVKTGVAKANKTTAQSRYIPKVVRDAIRIRSKDQCEYVDPLTKQHCENKYGLQFDHIQPHALGGTSELHNIRHLCRTHNLWAAMQVFGTTKMKPFLKNAP